MHWGLGVTWPAQSSCPSSLSPSPQLPSPSVSTARGPQLGHLCVSGTGREGVLRPGGSHSPLPPLSAPDMTQGQRAGDAGFIDRRVRKWPLLSQMTCHLGSVRTVVIPRKKILGHSCKGCSIRVSTCFPLKESELKLPVQSSTFHSLSVVIIFFVRPWKRVPLPMLYEDRDDPQVPHPLPASGSPFHPCPADPSPLCSPKA